MSTLGIIAIVLVYLIIAGCTFKFFTSKWDGDSKLEQIYFALIWPLLIPLYIVHWIHNMAVKD